MVDQFETEIRIARDIDAFVAIVQVQVRASGRALNIEDVIARSEVDRQRVELVVIDAGHTRPIHSGQVDGAIGAVRLADKSLKESRRPADPEGARNFARIIDADDIGSAGERDPDRRELTRGIPQKSVADARARKPHADDFAAIVDPGRTSRTCAEH